MVKGVVFDMDGLMFDTETLALDAWSFAGEKLGFCDARELAVKTVGLNGAKTKTVFLEHFGDDFDYESARSAWTDYMTGYINTNGIPAKPGLHELLVFLKTENYAITVASSSNRETANYYFAKAGIDNYFTDFVSGDMILKSKPDPEIYTKASEIIGIPATHCMALEDSPVGILSAYNAGMKPVMIPDMIQPDDDIKKILFANVGSLLDVIKLLKNQ